MTRDGIVTHARGVLAITPSGRPFTRVVASIFDSFRRGAVNSFSLAV